MAAGAGIETSLFQPSDGLTNGIKVVQAIKTKPMRYLIRTYTFCSR